jgi:hypothetical protein
MKIPVAQKAENGVPEKHLVQTGDRKSISQLPKAASISHLTFPHDVQFARWSAWSVPPSVLFVVDCVVSLR